MKKIIKKNSYSRLRQLQGSQKKRTTRGAEGDTIIEIMITTTVLALVLAVSFVSANRSLSSGTQAANRRQALQYAEQQVELIRVAANASDQTTYKSYTQNAQAFCINPDGTRNNSASSDPNSVCTSLSNQDNNFRDGIVYTASNHTFTVSVKWEHPGDNGGFSTANNNLLDQVTLYYQDPQ